jgi:Protein of unknown function (DUF3684)
LTALHIEAEVVGLVYEVGPEANSLNIVLTTFAANVAVHLDEKMKGELRRAIKKNPLSRLCYELIYVSLAVVKHILKMCSYSVQTGMDEYDSSVRAEGEATYATGSVFQGLRADLEGFVALLGVNVIINPSNRAGSTRVYIVSVCCPRFVGKFSLLGPRNWTNHWYRRTYGRAVHSDSRA